MAPDPLAGIAPEVRIRRDFDALARWRGECDLTHARLAESARARNEEEARSLLDRMIPGFRESLARSPFYRESLAASGMSPSDLGSVSDIASFPLLDRETLGARWRDVPVLAAGDPRTEEGAIIFSSGSTGAPIRVFRDGYEMLHTWAVLRFFCESLRLKLPPAARIALVDDLPGGVEYESQVPVLEGGGALLRVSTKRDGAAARLARFDPHVLFSDPSGLHWMVSCDVLPRPLVALSSAQYLHEELRARCESLLEAPLVDYYSTTETGPIAWSCPRDPRCFHVLAPDIWVESVGGRLAVTKLRPSALPLLRYLTGDSGEVGFSCACGFKGWVIRGFKGRSACEFLTPSGRAVDAWQLAFLFKHHGLDRFILEQAGPRLFLLSIAEGGARDGAAGLVRALTGALVAMGFDEPAIEVVAMPDRKAAKPEPFRRLD